MYHGSSMDVLLAGKRHQPFLFYVFSDGLIVAQPPSSKITFHGTEYFPGNTDRHVTLLSLIQTISQQTASKSGRSVAFRNALNVLTDAEGFKLQLQHIPMQSILSARVSKKAWFEWRIVLKIKDTEGFNLVAGKKAIKEFAAMLRAPLGDRLIDEAR